MSVFGREKSWEHLKIFISNLKLESRCLRTLKQHSVQDLHMLPASQGAHLKTGKDTSLWTSWNGVWLETAPQPEIVQPWNGDRVKGLILNKEYPHLSRSKPLVHGGSHFVAEEMPWTWAWEHSGRDAVLSDLLFFRAVVLWLLRTETIVRVWAGRG